MKGILKFFMYLCICWALTVQGAETTRWSQDATNVLKSAQEKQRPVLIEFTAPWCPYCKTMETKVFNDSKVQQELSRFELLSINIDKNAELAARHSVRGIPAFVVLDSSGEEVTKTSGFMEAEPFSQWLQSGLTNLTVSVAQKEEFQKTCQEIKAGLSNNDPETRKKAFEQVLNCCEQKEKAYRIFAQETISQLVKEQPAMVLEGLNHSGLSARIQIANLLRKQFGDRFDIDPWESSPIRKEAVLKWQSHLREGEAQK